MNSRRKKTTHLVHPEDDLDRKMSPPNKKVPPLVTEKDTEYYPLESSTVVKDSIGRVRYWLEALEKPNTRYSRWQVAKDLIDLAIYVMYDDAGRIGKVEFARELLKRQRKT